MTRPSAFAVAASLALASLTLASLTLAPPAAAETPPQSANVHAFQIPGGQEAGPNPVLQAGDRLRVVVTGFAPHESVALRNPMSPVRVARASKDGVVNTVLVITGSSRPGEYVLVFIGHGLPPAPPGSGYAGSLSAIVPPIGLFPCRVTPRSADDPPFPRTPEKPTQPEKSAQTGTPSRAETSQPSGGGLPLTGGEVILGAALGAVVLSIGFGCVVIARRVRGRSRIL